MNNYESLDNDFYETPMEEEHFKPWGMELRQFTILMHLSQFAGIFVPMGGLVLPIIMWVTNREQSQTIDRHGKSIVNWMLSLIIFLIGSAILSMVLIGIPMIIALVIANFIFVILGAVRAREGKLFTYPMSFNFIK